jgi:hypothetical protein
MDTAHDAHQGGRFAPGERYPLAAHAAAVLTAERGGGDAA